MTIHAPDNRQQGVTLLEVLISIVVLSLGLLGMAGLHAVSLKNNTSAYQRGLATMLAYDVIDRIRANMPNKSNYEVALNADGTGDVADWKSNVKSADALPSGNASVVIDLTNTVTVTIQWDDNRDNAPIQVTTQTSL